MKKYIIFFGLMLLGQISYAATANDLTVIGRVVTNRMDVSTIGKVAAIGFVDGSTQTTAFTGGGGGAGGSYAAIVLIDSNSVSWNVTVSSAGNLVTTKGSFSSGSYKGNNTILQDVSGNFWSITISFAGNLITSSGGTLPKSFRQIPLLDSNNLTWLLTVSNSGNLITS